MIVTGEKYFMHLWNEFDKRTRACRYAFSTSGTFFRIDNSDIVGIDSKCIEGTGPDTGTETKTPIDAYFRSVSCKNSGITVLDTLIHPPFFGFIGATFTMDNSHFSFRNFSINTEDLGYFTCSSLATRYTACWIRFGNRPWPKPVRKRLSFRP